MGILGMEERVKRLGGTLRVESQPGKGATVTAELPIPGGGSA
jgi:signal transduction histidine kinase